MEEEYDFTSIFDVGEAPTSNAMLSKAAHNGMTSFAVASIDANNAPQNTVAAHSGMTSFSVAIIDANNAPQNMVASYSGMTSFAVSSVGANNAPQNTVADHSGMTIFAVVSFGDDNAPQNMVTAQSQLPPVAPSSNFGVGEWSSSSSTVDDEGIFDLDDLFTDQMFLNW